MDFDTANEDITSHELLLYFRYVEISTCCFKSWRHHTQDTPPIPSPPEWVYI